MAKNKTMRLVLGDQLNRNHSWYAGQTAENEGVLYVMMEVRSETDYARHHIQKVLGIFLAMRSFAMWLGQKGLAVEYLSLDDPKNKQDIVENLRMLAFEHGIEMLEYQMPDEWRVDAMLSRTAQHFNTVRVVDTEHFMTDRLYLKRHFAGKKEYVMESFYRQVRKDYKLMMDAQGKPWGGKWNYDKENRNAFDGKVDVPDLSPIPSAKEEEVAALEAMLQQAGVDTIGSREGAWMWPVTREDAIERLGWFCQICLPHFGKYQDSMTTKKGGWHLFHSLLSFAMNLKMISPLEVVVAAIEQYERRPDEISLAQLEGFVRQIVGWREYMRGIYWAEGPKYASRNHLEHKEALPEWFWTGETKMRCLNAAIGQSLRRGYAHHIQRLMVTGNFALLLGVDPDAVDAWYLGIYVDAIEWVEITNTRGMSQYADGGIVGTKPYISSANYIDKMSDYCKGCTYNAKKRVGADACPFNGLYWEFLLRHQDKLKDNSRMWMMYSVLNKMSLEDKEAILLQADAIRKGVNSL